MNENNEQAQHERHLAELSERVERHHREFQDQLGQFYTMYQEILTIMKTRDEEYKGERKQIAQLLSHESQLLALMGDGSICEVVPSGEIRSHPSIPFKSVPTGYGLVPYAQAR